MGRYSLRDLSRALREPKRFKEEFLRLRWDARRKALEFNKSYYRTVRGHPETGIYVMEQDWDNLLLLDACRHDMYSELSTLDGDCKQVLSRGSQSWEFMEENFVDGKFHDTVYVTANPHAYSIPDRTFHAIEFLLEDCWDEETRTVLPETVAKRTLEAIETYPNKRLIVHFMQPHFPFLGQTGQRFDHVGVELHLEESKRSHAVNPWEELMFGSRLNEEMVIQAYRENYKIVLPYIEDLVAELSGKTVLTADHGNLLGEYTFPIPLSTYGHPPGIYKQKLLEVPWVRFALTDDRRRVTADPPVESKEVEEETIKQRLEQLGYHG